MLAFWIMLLSRSHQVLDSVCISKGGSAATVVDPKILYRKVLEFGDNLTWGCNGIFKSSFKTITFTMYPIYLNLGFGYAF